MRIIKYNKLIRDNIPLIIESLGDTSICEAVTDKAELLDYLNTKLNEEVQGYNDSYEMKELADIVEVIRSIVKLKGYEWEYLESIREDKKASNGGFDRGLLLKEVYYR